MSATASATAATPISQASGSTSPQRLPDSTTLLAAQPSTPITPGTSRTSKQPSSLGAKSSGKASTSTGTKKKRKSKAIEAATPAATPPPAPAAAGWRKHLASNPLLLAGGVCGVAALGVAALLLLTAPLRRRGRGQKGAAAHGKGGAPGPGPWAKLKATSKCVPLADGSACVVRREIAADNSCLFNSIGYAMHKSKTRAPHLRNVVAQQVSADRATYSEAFLGMSNEAYCHWIRQPYNWGGGIELSILAQAYGIEIAAWNIETCKEHVFGEESGYKRRVMVIYNGVHYDALAVCAGPRANPDNDDPSFNPRSKRGKAILEAARRLVEAAHRESPFHAASAAKKATATATATATAAAAPSSASTASGEVAPKKRAVAKPSAAAAAASKKAASSNSTSSSASNAKATAGAAATVRSAPATAAETSAEPCNAAIPAAAVGAGASTSSSSAPIGDCEARSTPTHAGGSSGGEGAAAATAAGNADVSQEVPASAAGDGSSTGAVATGGGDGGLSSAKPAAGTSSATRSRAVRSSAAAPSAVAVAATPMAGAASSSAPAVVTAAAAGPKLCCGDCGEVLCGGAAAAQHARATGHQNYQEVA